MRRISARGARFASVKSRLTATSLSRLAGSSLAKQVTLPYHHRFDAYHRLNLARCRDFEQEFNLFLLSSKKAGLCVNLCFGRIYAPEKSALTHLFKLKELANLWVKTGEVMVFLTLLYSCGLKPRQLLRFCPQEFSDVQEIYRLRRRIIERLVRRASALRWRLEG